MEEKATNASCGENFIRCNPSEKENFIRIERFKRRNFIRVRRPDNTVSSVMLSKSFHPGWNSFCDKCERGRSGGIRVFRRASWRVMACADLDAILHFPRRGMLARFRVF
ncbi:MAG: hypothetical protein LBO00_07515 [Zoogloeaceae bacterium]|nr:hypothetical protein [Zoogloeaceae bacterium]